MASNEEGPPQTLEFWCNFAGDWVVTIAVASFGFSRYSGTTSEAALYILGALAAWPLLEYLFHRWLMHGPMALLRRAHEDHHLHPRSTPMTPWHVHLWVGGPLWALLAALTSAPAGALLTAGLYLGYIWFRLIHRLVHFHAQTIAARFLGSHLRLHALHHARPDRLYGVTTSFWDRVFGTFEKA